MAKKKSNPGNEAGVSNAVLRRMAGEENFNRGEDLFCHGHVQQWSEQPDGIAAQVRADRIYNPKLNIDDGMLDFSCDCSTGQQGVLCMHAVAAAFAWRKAGESGPKRTKKPAKLSISESVKHFLEASTEEMESLLLEWSSEDASLRERLTLYAAKRTGAVESAAALKTSFELAVKNRRYKMNVRELKPYVKALDAAIASLEKFCDEGHPAAVAHLCRQLLPYFGEQASRVLYGEDLYNREKRIETLHQKACEQAPPDPIQLAKLLFDFELRSEFHCFVNASVRYADLLGPEGIAESRRLVENAWKALPPPDTTKHYWVTTREEPFLLRQMDRFARERKDWDALMKIYVRYRNRPDDYLKLARLALEAGNQELAIQWARNGVAAFGPGETFEIREFLTQEFLKVGRQDDAVNTALDLFRQTGWQTHYRLLSKAAVGWPGWEELRAKLVAQVMRKIESGALYDGTALAVIYVEDGEWKKFWELVRKLGCDISLLNDAAIKAPCREGMEAYFSFAARTIENTNGADNRESVEVIDAAWALAGKIDDREHFLTKCKELMGKFARRRSLLDILQGRYGDSGKSIEKSRPL